MLPIERELAAFKFVDELSANLTDVRDPHKALRHALRDTREFFQATHGCIATLRAGRAEAELLFTLPKHRDWDLGVLTRYIRHTYPPVERDMLIGSVRRRGGAWGAMALVRSGRAYDREDRRLIARIAVAVSAAVHRIDRDRLLGVRDRIDRKIMEQIHPKDLFYQILDGLRSLTLYDHSSALLIREDNEPSLRLVANKSRGQKPRVSESVCGFRSPSLRHRCSNPSACTVSIGRARHGEDGMGSPRVDWRRCSTTTSATRRPPAASGSLRCCARRWSPRTASSVC